MLLHLHSWLLHTSSLVHKSVVIVFWSCFIQAFRLIHVVVVLIENIEGCNECIIVLMLFLFTVIN